MERTGIMKRVRTRKGTEPDRRLCASCGYVELYVSSEQDLQVVRETWEKVLP